MSDSTIPTSRAGERPSLGKHAEAPAGAQAGSADPVDPVEALPKTGHTPSSQTTDPHHSGKGEDNLAARLGEAGFFRILGLVAVLVVVAVVGTVTAGDRFLSGDNFLTILRASAAIGVVAIGMTFVITGGGIDLSVGALVALSSVWATTVANKEIAADTHWAFLVLVALLVGGVAGLVNGVLIAYGKVVAFIATLAMLVAARGLAELISDNRNQSASELRGLFDFFGAKPLGIDMVIWVFVVVAVVGWVVLNRTTFGRRTFAVGGNPEAARLAGINVRRHTLLLYVLTGVCAGLAATMMIARTTVGTSSHGELWELDAIAAVVIGGTLLAGGRGTITGTVMGVLIFTTLTNVFVLNNRPPSEQDLLKGAVIVAAVLLQQFVASRKR
ncbi:ABC transporter permease, partial [Nocardioides litoris]|uniref:ABC transporter permease n=1 Tax=Nocardioides litoris TaxID=1926648 RepID=UPI00111F7E63